MTATVTEGELIDFKKFGKQGRITILPACENKEGGNWYCVTHDTLLDSPFTKDDHLEIKKNCRMAWKCNQHGLEQP